MKRQYLIAIGREFGSGGHESAKLLAERLGINFYDRSILDEIAAHHGVDADDYHKHDEQPRKLFFSRRVRGYSNSLEEAMAEIQFDYIREKAESGESFVIVGRCADEVLKYYDGLIKIFITGDREEKMNRVMKIYGLDPRRALEKIDRHDKKRRQYHNQYSTGKWGDSRHYDLCINTTRIGVEFSVDLLEGYVRACMMLDDQKEAEKGE